MNAQLQGRLGLNIHQRVDLLPYSKGLGASIVRVDTSWPDLEPQQGQYTWGWLDALVEQAVGQGLLVYPTLSQLARWVTSDSHGLPPSCHSPSDGFGRMFQPALVGDRNRLAEQSNRRAGPGRELGLAARTDANRYPAEWHPVLSARG